MKADTIFRNKKTGNLYRFLYHAIDCTNSRDGTIVAVYCSVDDCGITFVREVKEFQDKFEVVG